jgi:CBS-domain-containing membrane protein
MMPSSPEDLDMDPKYLLVADVMSVDPVVVRVDASLAEADVVLRSTYVRGIPVVDRNGALVGVLSHAQLAEYRFAHRVASVGRIGSDSSRQAGGSAR